MKMFAAKRIRQVCLLLLLAALAAALGCGRKGYPANLRYPLRSDPLFDSRDLVPSGDQTGPSLDVPDPPGTFPVMTMAQLRQPSYPLNMVQDKALNPRDLSAEDRRALTDLLLQCYGTPAFPMVEVPLDDDGNPAPGWENAYDVVGEVQEKLKLDAETLWRGSRLYRVNCLHCHGLAGDGRGPTAFWINPHPRDYRPGTYKFTSTELGGNVRPQRADLLRTLRTGIDGTAMPAFNVLPDEDLEAMVSYVIHLSLRGSVEEELMKRLLTKGGIEASFEADAQRTVASFTGQWLNAQGKLIAVPDYPYPDEASQAASVLRGEQQWHKSACYKCHTDFGRQATFSYDAWGTLTRPANLTTGIFRGGRRPVDLYWRIYGGVHGTAMAANPDLAKKEKGEVHDRIWDLVNFLEVLPYRAMRDQYGVKTPDLPPVKEEPKQKSDAKAE